MRHACTLVPAARQRVPLHLRRDTRTACPAHTGADAVDWIATDDGGVVSHRGPLLEEGRRRLQRGRSDTTRVEDGRASSGTGNGVWRRWFQPQHEPQDSKQLKPRQTVEQARISQRRKVLCAVCGLNAEQHAWLLTL